MSELNKAVTWGFGLGCGCLLLLLFLFFGFMIFGAIIAPRVIDPPPVKPAVQQDRVDLKKESSAAPIKPREEVERMREEQPKTTQDETKAPEAPARSEAQSITREFVIICEDDPASLYEAIDSEKALLKIPAKTKLEVKSKRDVRQGRIIVTWFEVCYKDKTGWVSQYHTTGDLIKEIASGGESSTPMPGQDDVRVGTFTKEAKKTFQEWVLQNMAVTHFEYPQGSDSSIWVRLKPDLYKTKEGAETAAVGIARAYKLQTGYEGLVIVTVWHHSKDEIFAKGNL